MASTALIIGKLNHGVPLGFCRDSTFSVTDDMSRLMIEKRKDEKYRWANMQGPFHPLEYNVVGAHRQASLNDLIFETNKNHGLS